MENIQFDAFNPGPYVNHVSEMKIAANKRNMELILILGGVVIIGFVIYKLHEHYKEELER